MSTHHSWIRTISIFLLVLTLAGCSGVNQIKQPVATSLPTPTEAPMALRVNGEGITEVEYQLEITSLQSADKELGIQLEEKAQKERVQNELIDEVLLAQGASLKGHSIDESTLQRKIADLASQLGGMDKLKEWQTKYGYADAQLRVSLRRNMAAAWMRDQIATEVGDNADQVHARQIRVSDEGTAQNIQQQLQAGVDFATLAGEYDPLTKGDLGWFPHGYLFQPDVDDAAFSLQTGQVSPVIKTSIGYHFIQVIERDSKHPLSPETKLFLQHKAVDDWLKQQRTVAKIELIEP